MQAWLQVNFGSDGSRLRIHNFFGSAAIRDQLGEEFRAARITRMCDLTFSMHRDILVLRVAHRRSHAGLRLVAAHSRAHAAYDLSLMQEIIECLSTDEATLATRWREELRTRRAALKGSRGTAIDAADPERDMPVVSGESVDRLRVGRMAATIARKRKVHVGGIPSATGGKKRRLRHKQRA